MKKVLFAIAIIQLCNSTNAQSLKKPEVGSVGLRYGVFFVNGVSNQFAVSGWLKKDFEVGSGLAVGYYRDQVHNTSYDRITVQNVNGQTQSATSDYKRKSSNVVLQISPYVNKHFFLKEALDLYVGFFIPVEMRISSKITTEETVSSEGYLSQYTTVSKSPMEYGIGGGLILGCNYFITKNFAVGVSTAISGVYSFAKGKTVNARTNKSSGINHPQNGQSSSWEETIDINNNRFYLNANQSAGINFTYYFNVKKAAKTDI